MGPVAAIDRGPLAPIFGGFLLGLLDQPGDLLLTEVGAALDTHALLAAGGAVGGRYLEQAVGVDIERHLHLGHSPGCRRDAGEAEAPQALVVGGHLALPLEHVDLHRALVGLRRAEHIALAHRNRRVARDQHLHHPAYGLEAKRQRCHVVEHQVAQLAGEDSGLHRCPDRYHLIGVHRLAGLQGNEGAHHLLHHRHAGGAAHQHHIVDVVGGEAGIPQGALHRPQQPIEQVGAEALEGAALEGGFDVQRAVIAGGDERQGDGGALHTAQLDLGLLRRFGEALQGLAVAAQIHTMLLLEPIGDPVHDAQVPVVATQLGITAGGLHIEHALGNSQHRYVEGAAAQVEHQHPLHGAAVEAVGQCSGSGFVEDALHADPRQPSRIAGGLALGVIEVGRHGDHRGLHRLPQIGGRVVAELAQDARHQLFWGVLALCGRAHHAHVAQVVGAHGVGDRQAALVELLPLAPHEALEVGEGIAGIEHQLAPGQLTNHQLLLLAETHHRGGGAAALGTGDHLGPPTLENRHHGVGGA